mgnify:CR=1 FL=1
MADALPPPDRQSQEQSSPRWPWIMGGLLGGFFLLAAGLGLGVLAFFGGMLFLSIYLLIQTGRSKGDMKVLLLGEGRA